MNLVSAWLTPGSVAEAVLVLFVISALGIALGHLRWLGLRLGVAGVLFVGLGFGSLGVRIQPEILGFTRDLGLILFVYAVGIQVGPGFAASLRKEGLPLNIAAGLVVMGGAGIAWAAHRWGGLDLPAAVGLFSGATTNTPSLAAAEQALRDIPSVSPDVTKLPAMGYAIAYPFGILGIILTMMITRFLFRIQPAEEVRQFEQRRANAQPAPTTLTLEVTNANLDGHRVEEIPGVGDSGVVISRILKNGVVSLALPDTPVRTGDVILAVGPVEKLEELRLIVGREREGVDLREMPSAIDSRRLVVTKKSALGQTIEDLDLTRRFGATITRVSRMEMEIPAHPDVRLKFGDTVLVVGGEDGLKRAAELLGDSPKALNDPQVITLLLGIALGVAVGSVPIHLPGFPAPVKLGLAGGPLLMAILLSRVGRVGGLVWHMPISANYLLREFGIALFLSAVGLRSGDTFWATFLAGGWHWLLWGAAITLVPLLLAALALRTFLKTNFASLCGMLAGSMTDPPALAFANTYLASEAPALSYSAVYPLTMLLRVLAAQAMILLLMR
jgi:putative transport protein